MSNRYVLLMSLLVSGTLVLAACGAPTTASADPVPVVERSAALTETTAASGEVVTATEVLSATGEEAGGNAISETVVAADATTPVEVRGVRTFLIVPSESIASYIADEEFFADALAKYGINAGKQDTIGSTQEISGRLTLDLDNLESALGENTFTVMMNTLESDQGLRDGYIRNNGPRFNQYPEAIFVATSIEGAPATYSDGDEVHFQMAGNMTIREITQPVSFDVVARLTGTILTGVAETSLLMSDFGIEPLNFLGTLTVADEIGIKVEFTAQAE